jgi:hypothetical protein
MDHVPLSASCAKRPHAAHGDGRPDAPRHGERWSGPCCAPRRDARRHDGRHCARRSDRPPDARDRGEPPGRASPHRPRDAPDDGEPPGPASPHRPRDAHGDDVPHGRRPRRRRRDEHANDPPRDRPPGALQPDPPRGESCVVHHRGASWSRLPSHRIPCSRLLPHRHRSRSRYCPSPRNPRSGSFHRGQRALSSPFHSSALVLPSSRWCSAASG